MALRTEVIGVSFGAVAVDVTKLTVTRSPFTAVSLVAVVGAAECPVGQLTVSAAADLLDDPCITALSDCFSGYAVDG